MIGHSASHLVTQPYCVADAHEYVTYLEHVLTEADRLRAEGRLPDSEALLTFFDDTRAVQRQVRLDITVADGSRELVSRFAMSRDTYRRMTSMSESLLNLLEILELRQAVELHRTDAAARVADAIKNGRFEEESAP